MRINNGNAIDTTVGASFIIHGMRGDYSVTETQVECVDLDAFIRGLQKRVCLLKLDIEGSEIAVLNRLLDAGTIDLIDLVVVETPEKQISRWGDGRSASRSLATARLKARFAGGFLRNGGRPSN
jgi:hypothetical protein